MRDRSPLRLALTVLMLSLMQPLSAGGDEPREPSSGQDAPGASGAQHSLPMGGLLRGAGAAPPEQRMDTDLKIQRPGKDIGLTEPPPLFPEVMGPLPAQPIPPGLASLSSQTCGACHLEIHRQWSASAHAAAWTDPIYQASLKAAGTPNACIHCHTPLTEQQPQRIVGWEQGDASRPKLANNPDFIPSLQEEGVTCASCHVRDGVVYGTRTLPRGRAPHPVVAHPDLKRPSMCAACHQLALPGAEERPFYDTYGEWSRSTWGARGVTCQDCHMPYELAGSTRPQGTPTARRSHLLAGGKDDETVRRALTVMIETDKPQYDPGDVAVVTIRVLNTGAGHSVPTTAPFRRIAIEAGTRAPTGELTPLASTALERQMSVYPPFMEIADRRLKPDGEVRFDMRVPIPESAARGPLAVGVDVIYQAVPPEVAQAHSLSQAQTSRTVLRRTASLMVK